MDTAQNPPNFYTPPPTNLVVDPPAHPQPSVTLTSPPSTDSLIAQSLTTNLPTPPTLSTAPGTGSVQKETGPIQESNPLISESAALVEIAETEPIPEEVEGWLQKLDQAGDIKLNQPLTHDGDILLADTEAQVVKEKLVLPLSQSGVNAGLHSKVSNSARWLAEWCVRLIKMMKDKVKYASEPAQ